MYESKSSKGLSLSSSNLTEKFSTSLSSEESSEEDSFDTADEKKCK